MRLISRTSLLFIKSCLVFSEPNAESGSNPVRMWLKGNPFWHKYFLLELRQQAGGRVVCVQIVANQNNSKRFRLIGRLTRAAYRSCGLYPSYRSYDLLFYYCRWNQMDGCGNVSAILNAEMIKEGCIQQLCSRVERGYYFRLLLDSSLKLLFIKILELPFNPQPPPFTPSLPLLICS